MAANTFQNRAVWDASAAAGNTDYVVGVSLSAAIAGAAAGDTINVQAGTYGGGVTLGMAGLTLSGATGSVIDVAAGQTGIAITANNVIVKGLEIVGPVTGAYEQVNWGTAGSSTGISVSGNVSTGPSGFNITGNDIQDIRTGIIVLGQSASGSITGNEVDNTKGGILIQYNDGTPYTISGNQQGAIGNEWGIVLNLNTSGGNTGQAPTSWQSALLALSNGNNGLTVMDRKYASANRTGVVVDASSTATAADDSNLGNGLGNARQPLATIQAGINAVVAGGTVNVDNGTYVIASGGGNYINVNKSLNLVGQSEAGVIIDARNASTYGLRVTAATGPVTLSNFTLYGVTASGGYGLKAEGTQGLTLSNITSEGAYKSEFDLNGVVGGTLNGLTANGDMVGTSTPTAGNGISLTDSQDITITNSVTENNAWGGLALYQGTTYGSLQLTDITVDGSNTFSEADGIYAQNQSSVSIGTINLTGQGIQYIAQLTTPVTSGDGVYTLFQKTQQGAIDQAAGLNAKYSVAGATVQGYVGTSLNGTNIFTVGQATDGDVLSVNAALSQSSTGGVIDVLSGTYAEAVAIQAPRTINFDDVTLNSLTSSTGAAGSILSGNVAAGSVALNGATVLGGNLTLDTSASNGNVTMAVVDGATAGGQALTILTGSGVLSLGNAGATTALSTLTAGNATLTGSTYDAGTIGLSAVTLGSNAIVTGNSVTLGSVDGKSAGGQSLTVAANTASLGNVGATTALSSLTAGNVTLTGSIYDAGTIGLGAATLSGNATFTGNSVTLGSVDGKSAGGQSLTVAANTDSLGNVGATTALGSLTAGNVTLTGSTYDAGTIGLSAVTLGSNATFTGNSVTLGSVDGTTAGRQSLTVTGNTATLGNLGATTRLGAVDVAANTTLSRTNDAASFTFGGSVTLTAASTVLDTTLSSAAAGNITFTGAIFGTGDSGQSLTLSAGPGTGAASANGDITMANAGTTTVRLGTLNVSGNNFTALTVDLAGDFTSRLIGNQVFAADTLNAGGNVNTQAGGNVSGHIVSAGTVALTTPGIVSGNIGGSSLVLNSGSVSNATLTGNSVNANVTNGFNATVNATNSANIAANTISGNIGGSSLVLNSGSVSNATLTGNSVNANVTNGFNATVNATNSANIAASTISGSISGATLTISGGLVSNATLSGTTVNANVTGGFNATVNASNSASIAANTISGNFSGATVSLNAQSVSGQVTATTLNVASQGGTVTGDFTPGNVTGFVDLNGQTTSGGPHVPGQQLVVENFALPAGTQIAANGALILPQGLVIGLLSPGGGPAEVIMVHDVQTLGQLLADGYVAIVIDLKNDKDAPVNVAFN
jgi:cytoskeletal protein CcmA (bactofilin family)